MLLNKILFKIKQLHSDFTWPYPMGQQKKLLLIFLIPPAYLFIFPLSYYKILYTFESYT